MLEALMTKISSAISPLRLVYHSSRPIDRRLMTCGFAEMPWFFLINVTGADRAQSSPEFKNQIYGCREISRTGMSAPHKKAQAGCPRLLFDPISKVSG